MNSQELRRQPVPVTPEVALLSIEYDKLKDEQSARIQFRDNMLYAALTAVGLVASYAVASSDNAEAWLVLPLIGTVLGWAYVSNDEKISAIGRYMRGELRLRAEQLGVPGAFGWEDSPAKAVKRRVRKPIQLVVDLCTFIAPGLITVPAYWSAQGDLEIWEAVLLGIEVFLLLRVGIEMIRISDIDRFRDLSPLVSDFSIRSQDQDPEQGQ